MKKVTISEELRSFRRDMTTSLVDTPFVMGLASGTLNPQVFDSFIELERIILQEFAKLYEIAKEQISDTDVKDAFHRFKTTALSQHPDFKHDLQLVEGGSTGVASKYIGFLREIGWKGKPHHILAAILPVMRTYRYLGWFLSQYATSKHPFFKWISTYGSDEFYMSVENMEHNLDKLVLRPGKKQIRNIFRISFRAKRLVAEILHALMKPTIIPLMHNHPDKVLFVGFDLNAAEDINHPVEESDGFINEDTGWCSGLFETTSALTRKSGYLKLLKKRRKTTSMNRLLMSCALFVSF